MQFTRSNLKDKKYALFILTALFFQIFFRLIFIFYGYIASEEGILITNQKLAYSGKLPFVDYNAWNSLLNDYLVGWFHYFIPATILTQRFFGLIVSILIFALTLKLVQKLFKNNLLSAICALLLTFGSYSYIYLSTVPFSDQTMSVILLVGFYVLAINNNKKWIIYSLVLTLFTISAVVRIQSLPVVFFLWILLLLNFKNNIKAFVNINLVTFICCIFLLLPFLSTPDNLKYALFWSLKVDKVLIYQLNSSYSFSKVFIYFQELFRDDLIFILVLAAGAAGFIKKFLSTDNNKQTTILLLFLTSIYFIFSGLLHKSTSAFYVIAGVPFMAISCSYIIILLLNQSTKNIKLFIYTLLVILFINSLLIFPHYRFIKTSASTINRSTYSYLKDAAEIVKSSTNENDEILSFYSPLTVESQRKSWQDFNMDRFSMTVLPNNEASKYHLINTNMLYDYILSKKPKIIAFTEKNVNVFAQHQTDVDRINSLISKEYDLIENFKDINKVEDPKTENLFIYILKN